MKILEHRALRGPNYCSRYQAIYLRLDIEDLEQRPGDRVPGIVGRLTAWIPGLREHRCSVGAPGGFLQRLALGTYAGHVVEHVAIELQNMIGFSVGYGKTVGSYETGIYDVVYRYRDEASGLAAQPDRGRRHSLPHRLRSQRARHEGPETPGAWALERALHRRGQRTR